MDVLASWQDKIFLVSDPDARIRNDHDLMTYATYRPGDPMPAGTQAGDPKKIPRGTKVRVAEIAVAMTGSQSRTVFARTTSSDGSAHLGWTSTRNFDGRFINETVGGLPPKPGDGRYGPNAAWSAGNFLGQVELVEIVDNTLEIERIARSTAEPYFSLADAARADGVAVAINSGFRSYPEQKFLWDGYRRGLPGFNTAARPGFSKHQNGIAFDIAVAGGAGSPVYDWLAAHATSFGFLRTVGGEPWHWEFDRVKADRAKRDGTFKAPGVAD